MNPREIELKTLLDIPEWEKLQDQLAKMTGTAIITVDYKGTPISKHSCRTDFCTVIRENPISRKRCYKCDALAGIEAVRLNKPFIYLCHCGIVDVAVPVVVGDKYLGAVMLGEVRIPNNDTDSKVERLVSEISSFQAEDERAREDLLAMYEQLPEIAYEKIVEIADMVDAVVKYVVNRALKNRSDTLQYEYRRNSALPPMFDGGEKADATLRELAGLSEPPTNLDYRGTSETEYPVNVGSAVYPAVAYVDAHRSEMPGMKQMATLCHLSSSYFSKLFLKEVGENYSEYLQRKKVEWASMLLANTNNSVSQIAFELGYQDISYFVKVFKKIRGMTPTAYRKREHYGI